MPKGIRGRKTCSVEGCVSFAHGLGMCGKHYMRWTNTGTTEYTPRTPEERFWARVQKTDGCWFWLGPITPAGYGTFGIEHRRSVVAHRYAYIVTRGPIPEGLTLDHLCRVRHCVNPTHLEPVTMRENTMRGTSFAAVNAAKTHCPAGHPYDAENTELGKSGARFCRICRRRRRSG